MVNGINSQSTSISQLQQTNRKPPSAEDMFKKLTEELGGDGTTINKEDLDSYIEELESSGSDDKKLGFLKQLSANFDKISGGDDSITVDELKSGMDYLKPPEMAKGGAQGTPPDPSKMFEDLSTKVGASSSGITEEDLQTYLEKLQANSGDSKEIEMISKLIEDFDTLSGDSETITASSMQSGMQTMFNSRMQWQDPSTITSDQLQPPIDLRV
jgi:hypothetical protein